MKISSRVTLSLCILILSLALAFPLRQAVYDLAVVPIAYLVWLLSSAYATVPEFLTWSALVVCVAIAVLMQLIPEPRPSAVVGKGRAPAQGPVESLAIWILRARTSNYFKWQVANRLGRVARRFYDRELRPADETTRGVAVDAYLAAGINQSFVDFPGPRHRLQRRRATPLDLDPLEVIDHLESIMQIQPVSDAESL